jgi:hypothetical protein
MDVLTRKGAAAVCGIIAPNAEPLTVAGLNRSLLHPLMSSENAQEGNNLSGPLVTDRTKPRNHG